jgi:hypothetical protein
MVQERGTGLAIVCQWNEEQFGRTEDSSNDIDHHWFVLEVLDDEDIENPNERLEFYKTHCKTPCSLEVIDYFCLPGEEMVGVCKTFWLKLVQRKWKKVFAERRRINETRATHKEIIYRERNGNWRPELRQLPALSGMLA